MGVPVKLPPWSRSGAASLHRKRPVILLLLIVIAPMVLLTWLAMRVVDHEKVALQEQVKQLLAARLEGIDASVVRHFQEVESDLLRITDIDDLSAGSLRALARREPRVDEFVVQDATGLLLHPPLDQSRNANEEKLLERIGQLIEDRELLELAGITSREAESRAPEFEVPLQQIPSKSRTQQSGSGRRTEQPQWTVALSPSQRGDDALLFQSLAESSQDESPAEGASAGAEPASPNPTPPRSLGSVFSEPVPSVPSDGAIKEMPMEAPGDSALPKASKQILGRRIEDRHGWLPWYFGRGVQLIFWRRLPGDRVIAVTLGRTRWISELVANLPDTAIGPNGPPSTGAANLTEDLIQLFDSQGKSVYQWGSFKITDGMEPAAETALSEPLSSWRLTCHAPLDQWGAGLGTSVLVNLGSGLFVASLGICLLAWLFYSEYRRDMQEAEQRVSFVNQVSHELRTPLTNIRMYAELLGNDLEASHEEMPRARERLKVIDGESQRLSRLISNVLTFARSQRGRLVLKREPGSVDAIVAHVVNGFGPGLQQAGVVTEQFLNAKVSVLFDRDVVEQILGNLLSNVEKYAAGHAVRVTTSHGRSLTTIEVSDGGPGLPAGLHERVFEPFFRLSDEVKHTSGTGIGLSIARELARLHGGDLVVVPCAVGCCFRLTLETPSAD